MPGGTTSPRAQIESRREIMDRSLDRLAGEDLSRTWGEAHRVFFKHPLTDIPVGGRLLAGAWNRGPFPVGGDNVTIECRLLEPTPALCRDGHAGAAFCGRCRQLGQLGGGDAPRSVRPSLVVPLRRPDSALAAGWSIPPAVQRGRRGSRRRGTVGAAAGGIEHFEVLNYEL